MSARSLPSAVARYSRVRDLFLDALELPPEDRPAFLDATCGGDSGLRAEVEELLRHAAAETPSLPPPELRPFSTLAGGRFRAWSRRADWNAAGSATSGWDLLEDREVTLWLLPRSAGTHGADSELLSLPPHRSLVPLLAVGREDDAPLLVVGACSPVSIASLAVREARGALASCAEGLAALHRRGLVHGAVTAAAVVRTSAGVALLPSPIPTAGSAVGDVRDLLALFAPALSGVALPRELAEATKNALGAADAPFPAALRVAVLAGADPDAAARELGVPASPGLLALAPANPRLSSALVLTASGLALALVAALAFAPLPRGRGELLAAIGAALAAALLAEPLLRRHLPASVRAWHRALRRGRFDRRTAEELAIGAAWGGLLALAARIAPPTGASGIALLAAAIVCPPVALGLLGAAAAAGLAVLGLLLGGV